MAPNPVALASLEAGWAEGWKSLGVYVCGWGWVEGDPASEAELAVGLCKDYGLHGYIANAEDPYELPANFWKSAAFTERFRELAPAAPLAMSAQGHGDPWRFLDYKSWTDANAVIMPQCYTGTPGDTWATSIVDPLASLKAYDAAHGCTSFVIPTLGTSTFDHSYPAAAYRSELRAFNVPASNIWLLESTTDDYLRALYP